MFVGCQVKLDIGVVPAARGDRAAVWNLTLARRVSAQVRIDLEGLLFGGKLDSGLLVNPIGNFDEASAEKGRVQVSGVLQRKIEVF